MRIGPYVGRVASYEDGDVADELQPARSGVRFQLIPLAKEEELLAGYRQSILSALVDVENALAAIQHFDLQRQAQTESLSQSERAFEGARLRYREGAADYPTLFESQRVLYAARDQYSQYQLSRLQALVTLGKALGGGWQSPDASLASQ